MKCMVAVLKCLAWLFGLLPLQDKITFLSRQGGRPSLDYRLLLDELDRRDIAARRVLCLTDPETKGMGGFILGTLKQLYHARTSRVCVVDGYVPAVSVPKKRTGVTVVQLWHALGAIKKFGYQSLDTPAGRSSAAARAFNMHGNYDCVIAAGPGAVPAFAQAFGYGQKDVVPLGMPRLDYLAAKEPGSPRMRAHASALESLPALRNGGGNVLYAPTLRKGQEDRNWLSASIAELASACESSHVNLIVAAHPLTSDADGFDAAKYPHVHFAKGFPSIDLLESSDCVITDYSAVAFEAALLRKAVYFYVPDIEAYRTSPGLNIDPLAEFPRIASADARELMGTMVLPFLEGKGPLGSAARNEFVSYAERYFEGVGPCACARIADAIERAYGSGLEKEHA